MFGHLLKSIIYLFVTYLFNELNMHPSKQYYLLLFLGIFGWKTIHTYNELLTTKNFTPGASFLWRQRRALLLISSTFQQKKFYLQATTGAVINEEN